MLERCLAELAKLKPETKQLDQEIEQALKLEDAKAMEDAFRRLAASITAFPVEKFQIARAYLEKCMEFVGRKLASCWEDDRYVRPSADDLEELTDEVEEREELEDREEEE